MARAGTAYIDFEGNFSGLHKQVNSQLKPLGGRFSKIGKAAAIGIGAGMVGLVKEGKAAVSAFEDAQKVGAQTTAVLKSTGGAAGLSAKQVSALATAISRKSGIDDEAVQSGENLLLTFTNVRNETGKGNQIFTRATGIMADMSTALGQDMKSSAIQLGKALNDPIKGVTALQRVGVSFTAQQKNQIKTLVDSGRTLDAQKVILRELNKEFGGSASAFGKTGAGQVAKLKTEFGNLQEKIGGALAPALTTVTVKLREFIQGINDGTGAGGRFASAVTGAFDKAKQALAPLARTLGDVWGNQNLDLGEKLSRSIAAAGPFLAGAAAKMFAAVAPRAAQAFVSAFQQSGPLGRLFIIGTLASKLGAFSAIGKAAAQKFSGAFSSIKFAGPIVAIAGLMAVLGRFSGATKSAAQASRDLADAMDEERDAINRVRDRDLDLAQARAQIKASALAVEAAEKDLASARKNSGKDSLAARQAENTLAQARIQHQRDIRALGDAERKASSDRRQAETTVNTMRAAQLQAAISTKGWNRGVQDLGKSISLLPAGKKVTLEVNTAEALARIREFSAAIDEGMARAQRAIALAGQVKAKGASASGMARSPLLFKLEDQLRLAQSASDQLQAMFDANDQRAQRRALQRQAHLGVELSTIKQANRAAVASARQQLAALNLEISRTAKLGKINLHIEGIQKAIDLRDAFKSIRSELSDKLGQALDAFQSKWEKTIGRDLDKANAAALDAFDAATAKQVAEGPAAQNLAALQAEADRIAKENEDAANARELQDAQDAKDAARIAEAQARIDETNRQRQITAAQDAADLERAQIERDRAAARTALEDQQQAERQARYDADSAAFQTLLKTQLDAEYAQLQQRKENYSRWASDVRAILTKFGLTGALNLDASTEAAIENAPAKKKGKTAPRTVVNVAPPAQTFRFYLDGKEIDVRVDQVLNDRDRGTAAAVAGGVG